MGQDSVLQADAGLKEQAAPRPEDTALYLDACGGDEAALEELITRYREPLTAFVRTLVRDPRDAEEVMIDAFAELAASRGRFRGKSTLKTYLFSIARHLALQRYGPFREVSVHEPQLFARPGLGETDEWLDNLLEQEVLRKLLLKLPLDCRQALSLIYLQGMSYQEVGEVMGKKIPQVTHLAARGRALMRALMDKPS